MTQLGIEESAEVEGFTQLNLIHLTSGRVEFLFCIDEVDGSD